jgi:hypothetical protein
MTPFVDLHTTVTPSDLPTFDPIQRCYQYYYLHCVKVSAESDWSLFLHTYISIYHLMIVFSNKIILSMRSQYRLRVLVCVKKVFLNFLQFYRKLPENISILPVN